LSFGKRLVTPFAAARTYRTLAFLVTAVPMRRRALAVHATVYVSLNALLIFIWAVTSRGYFWPRWTLLALGLPLAIHGWVQLVEERPSIRAGSTRAYAIHKGVYASFVLFYVFVWLATGLGYFWPMWPIIGLGAVLLGHRVLLSVRRRQGELQERIGVLEDTRAEAVDQQEDELRRIERDLHDGAQARLIALGMSLGMAEQKLQADPEAARALLADAQRGAREALEELRDLARGIHPPVLTDRGLAAAIATLVDRNPLRVDVSVDLPERPPPTVETAAYFVVAEGLANATKHARATQVGIAISSTDGTLAVEVVDDGKGGADPSGAGLSGLARRVRALDGRLEVASPEGGPTTLRAELPCAS
jgi:signal transduction histidine kinase